MKIVSMDKIPLQETLSATTLDVVRTVPMSLRNSKFDVTAIVDDHEIIGLEPGNTADELCGVAFDVGTTTVVGLLVDLTSGKTIKTTSRTNPQVKFGDDVISRIRFCEEHKDGLQKLHQCIGLLPQRDDLGTGHQRQHPEGEDL